MTMDDQTGAALAVTQGDVDFAKILCVVVAGRVAPNLISGNVDVIRAIASHRTTARADALEEATRIAEGFYVHERNKRDNSRNATACEIQAAIGAARESKAS